MPVDLTFRVLGSDQVATSLQQMENHARQMATAMTGTLAPAHQATRALSSAIMSATQVARLAGDSAKEFANKVDTLAIAIYSTSTLVQVLRGATLSWAAAMAVAGNVIAAVTGPVGLLVIGLAALTAGLIAANNQFGSQEEATHRLAEALVPLTAGLSLLIEKERHNDDAILKATKALNDQQLSTLKLTAANIPLAGSFEIARLKVIDYGIHLQKVGAELNAFADKMQATQFQDTVEAIGQAADRQRAFAGSLQTTEGQLRAAIGATAEYIRELRDLRDSGDVNVEQQKKLTVQIKGLQTGLISLNNELAAEHRHLASISNDMEVQMTLFERAKAIEAAEQRKAKFLEESERAQRASTEAVGDDITMIERDRALAQQAADERKRQFLELHDAAVQVAQIFGIAIPDALGIAQEAINRAKERAISLQQAITDIKFERDFRRELELLNQGFQDLNITVGNTKVNILDIKFGLEDMAIDTLPTVLKALSPADEAFRNFMVKAKEVLKEGFTNLFTDILTGAKSFGDALLNFFSSIVNAIANAFASKLATNIVNWLLPGFAQGGIVSGLTPLMAFQGGGVINRPTLAMVGEGGEREAIVPEHLWPVFNAGRGAGGSKEVIVNVNVVFDPRQLRKTSPDETTATVLVDLRTGGPISRQIRQTVR